MLFPSSPVTFPCVVLYVIHSFQIGILRIFIEERFPKDISYFFMLGPLRQFFVEDISILMQILINFIEGNIFLYFLLDEGDVSEGESQVVILYDASRKGGQEGQEYLPLVVVIDVFQIVAFLFTLLQLTPQDVLLLFGHQHVKYVQLSAYQVFHSIVVIGPWENSKSENENRDNTSKKAKAFFLLRPFDCIKFNQIGVIKSQVIVHVAVDVAGEGGFLLLESVGDIGDEVLRFGLVFDFSFVGDYSFGECDVLLGGLGDVEVVEHEGSYFVLYVVVFDLRVGVREVILGIISIQKLLQSGRSLGRISLIVDTQRKRLLYFVLRQALNGQIQSIGYAIPILGMYVVFGVDQSVQPGSDVLWHAGHHRVDGNIVND